VSVTVSNLENRRGSRRGVARVGDTGAVEPTPEEVRLQLGRILASDGFANADRMSGFLRYVVDQALAGESARVKEYAIGVEVFARDQSYDPRLDSIVRVEARRLRAKVDEYYAGAGASDAVLIKLRRGSYVPAFEHRADVAPEAVAEPVTLPPPPIANPVAPAARRIGTAARIGFALSLAALVLVMLAARRGPWATAAPEVDVAVLPFAEYSNDPTDVALAARLTDGVTSELARLGSVGVVSHTSALQYGRQQPRLPAAQIAAALNADLLVEGSASRTDNQVVVSIRLVNANRDRKMWVEDFTGTLRDPRELERRIAQAVAAAAARYTPLNP
jgi:TolB-like protein